MTPHLRTPWCGADELLDIIDQSSWPRISDVLESIRASQPPEQAITFLFMEMLRQRKKVGIKVTLSLPRVVPFLIVS